MKFMDKLKNIFFEEEEEEESVENIPVKQEKEVIAKKVEVPKRKVENIVNEINLEENNKNDSVNSYVEIKKEIKQPKIENDLIFDDDDFIMDVSKNKKEIEPYSNTKKIDNNQNLYKMKDLYKKEEVKEKKEVFKYEYTKTETKESKTFTPSPIISPIYGILDKNYKKEEVKEKKEIRISSRPVKMDLDSVRNKAFGDLEYDLFGDSEEEKEEKKEKEPVSNREIKKIYDMSKDDKPSIEKVTLGEADEYFNDLGLAYNTDYKDISKEIKDGKLEEKKEKDKDLLEDNLFDLIESMYDKEA